MSEAQFYSAGSPATYKRYKYVFGTADYDGVGRLKKGDYSYRNGSTWTTLSAHDLTGITYDANGNVATSPAPCSLTAVVYDHRNLPTSLTRSGVTPGYRTKCRRGTPYSSQNKPSFVVDPPQGCQAIPPLAVTLCQRASGERPPVAAAKRSW